ncbi:MAG TPA: VIT1/CCC1 transporter family protein [Burkholderiales bacterium]|nr:VIT1/CCC1 transporter family protein [Burkholderiales bacterium]
MSDSALEELRSAYLYRIIAETERGTAREALFRELAESAEQQASIWAVSNGAATPVFIPDLRTRIVAMLVRRYGARAMRGVLGAMKVRGMSIYSHPTPGHSVPGVPGAGGMESRHSGMGVGGNLRAAVFGVNDGLVSNLSLILGVAGASSNSRFILLSGIAGLVAGAFSMASGEWVSVRSQREMYEHQIDLERKELDEYPDEEAKELALVYAARGMQKAEASALAERLLSDPQKALDTLSREELGLNPDELGSPMNAAVSSFLSFAAGAFIPLLPFLIGTGRPALGASIIITAIALFSVGAAISLFTGRSAWRDGARMLGIGALAGALTYGIGYVLGVSLPG